MSLAETRLEQISWVEIERHQIGAAFDFDKFTMECISRKRLDGERGTFVLSRVDDTEGTYFQLEYLTVRPNLPPNDPRVQELGRRRGHQPDHVLARFRIGEDGGVQCVEEGRPVSLYTGQELGNYFWFDMRNSLKERAVGIRPEGVEKIVK